MLIITNLQKLFKSNILEAGSNEIIEIMYRDDDTLTVPEYQRLTNTKCKLSFTHDSTSSSAFSIGMHLGSLLTGSETVFYITDNEDLLKNPVFENGNASVHFVRTIDEIFKKNSRKEISKKAEKAENPKGFKICSSKTCNR